MIQWVYEACRSCPGMDTIIATDDQRIIDAAEGFGARSILTDINHECGTDRVCEVATANPNYDVYVNVQGDQPFVDSDLLSCLIAPFSSSNPPEMATLASPLSDEAKTDPNSVKVILDQDKNAIYFSRASIPFARTEGIDTPVFHHLGLYAFSKDFLHKFHSYPPTPLEQCEQLEQLRAIENGHQIRVSLIEKPIIEVNTPADLEVATELMRKRIGTENLA